MQLLWLNDGFAKKTNGAGEENYGALKHFPGHGATSEDSHQGFAYIQKTEEELVNNEWIPFKKGIEEGAKMIMVGHIVLF